MHANLEKRPRGGAAPMPKLAGSPRRNVKKHTGAYVQRRRKAKEAKGLACRGISGEGRAVHVGIGPVPKERTSKQRGLPAPPGQPHAQKHAVGRLPDRAAVHRALHTDRNTEKRSSRKGRAPEKWRKAPTNTCQRDDAENFIGMSGRTLDAKQHISKPKLASRGDIRSLSAAYSKCA